MILVIEKAWKRKDCYVIWKINIAQYFKLLIKIINNDHNYKAVVQPDTNARGR